MNVHELESIRSFVRSSNHWLNLMPDEESVFADAAYRGSQMSGTHCVERLAELFREDVPHHLAMIAQEAYRGIYYEKNQRNDVKTDEQCEFETIWETAKKGHTFPKGAIVLNYLPFEFRAAIDYRDQVDEETFNALCYGLYLNFDTDYLCVDDCWAETYFQEKRFDALDFEGLKHELLEVESIIKSIVGSSPERYYWNYCRSRNRFDRRLIKLFEMRKDILDRMLLATEDEKQRFSTVDNLLHDLTKKMYKRTANLYRSTIGNGDEAYDYNVDGWVSYYIDYDGEWSNVRELDTDVTYGSDFKYMMMCAYQQQELSVKRGMPMRIVSCFIGHKKEHTPNVTDEELGMVDPFDGESWYVTRYAKHPMSDKKICYAMHKLLTDSLLSIPDILRIEWFEVESQITSQYTKSPE